MRDSARRSDRADRGSAKLETIASLPANANHPMDAVDLVQVTLLRALDHDEGGPASKCKPAFTARQRRSVVNRIREGLRCASFRSAWVMRGRA